jgi:hypothetical protein
LTLTSAWQASLYLKLPTVVGGEASVNSSQRPELAENAFWRAWFRGMRRRLDRGCAVVLDGLRASRYALLGAHPIKRGIQVVEPLFH